MKNTLTQDALHMLFQYDAATGNLYWRERPREAFSSGYKNGETSWKTWNTRNSGKKINRLTPPGYVRAQVNGKEYFAHRIIWAMIHGEWPEEIDHINGNRSDNRLENLRAVDRLENTRNCAVRSDSTSGVTGVSYAKRDDVYIAYINIDRRTKVLGRFGTIEEAKAVRKQAERKYGFHKNHGRTST